MTTIYDEANTGKHLSLQHLNLAYAVSCILMRREIYSGAKVSAEINKMLDLYESISSGQHLYINILLHVNKYVIIKNFNIGTHRY
jgi:hypothetical protein